MAPDTARKFEDCTCFALRQATRRVTQFYDRFLAPSGLRTSQFSILTKLKRNGPQTVKALARELVMDRTTLGRNILPLARAGLVAVARARADRRSKELRLTDAGLERLRAAAGGWSLAQTRFEEAFGGERSAELRVLLQSVAASELASTAASPLSRSSIAGARGATSR
jgi:DNA-binding MarR family transcriptional regulator